MLGFFVRGGSAHAYSRMSECTPTPDLRQFEKVCQNQRSMAMTWSINTGKSDFSERLGELFAVKHATMNAEVMRHALKRRLECDAKYLLLDPLL